MTMVPKATVRGRVQEGCALSCTEFEAPNKLSILGPLKLKPNFLQAL